MALHKAILIMILCLQLSACATKPPASDVIGREQYEHANDPLEPFNRTMFSFNQGMDKHILLPIANAYNVLLPVFVQTAISNFIVNVRAPLDLINDLLQGDMHKAAATSGRFAANTILGLGGFYDFAAAHNLPPRRQDFGITLARWGMKEGPYLVMPIIGPGSTLDYLGFAIDTTINPVNTALRNNDLAWVSWALYDLKIIGDRIKNQAAMEEIEYSSLDVYATIRNLYRQQRATLYQ